VTTTCSPWSAGDVIVTTTSATGAFVEASRTVPVMTALPCAWAAWVTSALATTKGAEAAHSQ
jgi:hypothetical protein